MRGKVAESAWYKPWMRGRCGELELLRTERSKGDSVFSDALSEDDDNKIDDDASTNG